MRPFLVVVLLFPFVIFGSSFGILVGTEIGGRERIYLGGKLEMGETLRLGLDTYYVLPRSDSETEIPNYIELDPLVILSLGGDSVRFYVGAGPIVILDTSGMEFDLYSSEILRGKVGLALRFGEMSIFAEALTSFSYNPLGTSGIYAVQGGIALGF